MRKVLVLLLVLLVLLLALPVVGMATPMEPCPACEPGVGGAWGVCLAVLWSLVIAVPLMTTGLQWRTRQLTRLLLTFRLERPPRSP